MHLACGEAARGRAGSSGGRRAASCSLKARARDDAAFFRAGGGKLARSAQWVRSRGTVRRKLGSGGGGGAFTSASIERQQSRRVRGPGGEEHHDSINRTALARDSGDQSSASDV